ncbi:lysozyme C-1-like [Mixophyes fleayi]|uniref:lysozyme C-1-like n=1 Tax=Mixophyes fleayi TaxID=3061075 RepID=UPI003F4DD874
MPKITWILDKQMKVILCLAFLLCLHLGSEGKTFTKCELIRIFKEKGIFDRDLENWICLAYHESHFNNKLQQREMTSRSYGIFQIDSKYWCDDGKIPQAENRCRMSCQSLQDDNLEDDIKCAKRIMISSNGLSPWNAWRQNCKGRDLSRFTAGC